jgi:hemerythrin superfamily protein
MSEIKLARVVNKSLAGEAEHAVLQNVETNETFEFSKIVGENITDGDMEHPTIKRILADGHTVNISFDESKNVTLHF